MVTLVFFPTALMINLRQRSVDPRRPCLIAFQTLKLESARLPPEVQSPSVGQSAVSGAAYPTIKLPAGHLDSS